MQDYFIVWRVDFPVDVKLSLRKEIERLITNGLMDFTGDCEVFNGVLLFQREKFAPERVVRWLDSVEGDFGRSIGMKIYIIVGERNNVWTKGK